MKKAGKSALPFNLCLAGSFLAGSILAGYFLAGSILVISR